MMTPALPASPCPSPAAATAPLRGDDGMTAPRARNPIQLRALRDLDRDHSPFPELCEYRGEDEAGKRFSRRQDPWSLPVCRTAGREALYVCWGSEAMPEHLLLLCVPPGVRQEIFANFSIMLSEKEAQDAGQ